MTPAAQRLGMTQSGVSQAVAGLEQALGTVLFDRSLRPLALTAAGTVLLEQARGLLAAADGAVATVRAIDARPRSSITIAMAESMAGTTGPHLVRRLESLAERWRIWSGLSPDHHEALLSRAVDFVVTAGDELDGIEGLVRQDIVTEPFVMVLPRESATSPGRFPDPDALPFIRYSLRSTIGRQTERQLSRLGLSLPNRAEFDTATGQLAAVADGMGWCLTTPLCLAQERHRLDALHIAAMPKGAFTRTIALIGRSDDAVGLGDRIAGELRRILKDTIRPMLAEAHPTLGDTLTIHESAPDGLVGHDRERANE